MLSQQITGICKDAGLQPGIPGNLGTGKRQIWYQYISWHSENSMVLPQSFQSIGWRTDINTSCNIIPPHTLFSWTGGSALPAEDCPPEMGKCHLPRHAYMSKQFKSKISSNPVIRLTPVSWLTPFATKNPSTKQVPAVSLEQKQVPVFLLALSISIQLAAWCIN